MRVAFLSDLHGNQRAVRAVMEAVSRLHVDQVVIGGDVIDPLPGSREVAEFVLAQNYPVLRGNHEDYVIRAVREPESEFARHLNWAPVRQVARSIPPALLAQIETWPLTTTLRDARAGELLLCHASPRSNLRGWLRGVDEQLAQELAAERAGMIVCGHWHHERVETWREKSLVISGSVGCPLNGRARAEFVVLDSSSGRWEAQHEGADFDDVATWQEFVNSGWCAAGGPMAWLILDELRVHEGRMGRFFRWMNQGTWPYDISTSEGLREAVREFLRLLETWTEISKLVEVE